MDPVSTVLVQGITDACPVLVQGITDACPVVVQGITDACPVVVQGITDACPVVVQGITDACPVVAVAYQGVEVFNLYCTVKRNWEWIRGKEITSSKRKVLTSSAVNPHSSPSNSPKRQRVATTYPFCALDGEVEEISRAKEWLKNKYPGLNRQVIFQLVIDLGFLKHIPDKHEARKAASDYMKKHFKYDGTKKWEEMDVPGQQYKTNMYEFHELPYIVYSLRRSYLELEELDLEARVIQRMDIARTVTKEWVKQYKPDISGMLRANEYPYSAGSDANKELTEAAAWVDRELPDSLEFISVCEVMTCLGFSSALELDGYSNKFGLDSKEMFSALTQYSTDMSQSFRNGDSHHVGQVKYLVRALRKQYLEIRKRGKSAPANVYMR
jgi:hypothetical protein